MDVRQRDPWYLVQAGEYQAAIARYGELYEENPRTCYLHNRGLAYLLVGDYVAALGDLQAAARGEGPRLIASGDLILAGVCHWFLGNPDRAVEWWRSSLTAPYTDAAGGVTPPALLVYAGQRLHDASLRREGTSVLRKHWRNHQRREARRQKRGHRTRDDLVHPGLDAWPGAIVPCLLDFSGVDELRASAARARHPILRGRWECQAEFYIAVRSLAAGDPAGFREAMARCAAIDEGKLEHEHYLARWEVQRGFPEPAFGQSQAGG